MSNFQFGIGTGSGTLLSAFAFINTRDVLKTTLAVIAAVVSFAVSRLLQRWRQRR